MSFGVLGALVKYACNLNLAHPQSYNKNPKDKPSFWYSSSSWFPLWLYIVSSWWFQGNLLAYHT